MSSNGNGRGPQAPPPLPPSRSTRSNSFDHNNPSKPDTSRSSSSSSRSQRKSFRNRSNSDGVRTMQQQFYEQYQQQQHQWGYPMMYPNQPGFMPSGMTMPPPNGMTNPQQHPPFMSSSPSSQDGGHHSFSSSFGVPEHPPMYGSFGAPSSYHLSMRPPQPPQQHPQSPNFSGFNELSSIMGTGRSVRKIPSQHNGRPSFGHRRSASESAAPRSLPPNFMPQPFLDPTNAMHQRMGSFASQHSHHSAVNSESQPFLAASTIPTGGPRKSRSHMRQQSVNLYMSSYRGKEQPRSCRDVFWALLFLLQLGIMCWVGLKFGPDALVATSAELGPREGLEDDDVTLDQADEDETPLVLAYWNIIKMAYTCGAFAVIVSGFALAFMMAMSRRLVYVALVLSIGVSFAWGTIGIGISPKSFVPITGILALMLTMGYMFVVWDRIPFASANLTTALQGVRDNLGLVCIAFECQFLALVCSIYYSFTFVGLHNAMNNGGLEIGENWKVAVDGVLLISYFWTYQVLRHIVMVTVAGTIGSWWFKKPSALYPTFLQATIFNFGSICYGSLFVGFVQLLTQFTEGLRPNRDDSAMMCIYESCAFFQERIVACVDDLADSFTPWAFTYVGLYRYGLKEAGHQVNDLFDKRGWSRIVTDDLVPTVLAMVSLVIGGLTGSFAVILQALDGHGLTNIGHPEIVSFVIGFLIGIVLSTVLFSIISSSVAAVIVCFAGSPVEFHQNYPDLSHEMRHAWREVWPGSLDVGGVVVMAA